QRQIKDLHALIERVSGERITLNITNSFKNTAVLGKATTTANVENNAHQQAAIIKRELDKGWKPPKGLCAPQSSKVGP
ncbi:MAG: hypothetical protein ACRC9X_01360, partial [Bacteroidales bacterium]